VDKHSRVVRVAIPVTVALAIAIATYFALIRGDEEDEGDGLTSQATPWSARPLAEGDKLRIKYTGGVCDADADATVEESSTSVTVTVRTYVPSGQECTYQGVPRVVYAQLDAPLAARQLLDGACTPPSDHRGHSCPERQSAD
jgi:hypothetical protein